MRTILILLLFIPFVTFSQQYSGVIEKNGKSAEQLYTIAKGWYELTIQSPTDLILHPDTNALKIIGKGKRQVEYHVGMIPTYLNVYYTLVSQFEEHRCKYTLQSTEILSQGGKSYTYDQLKKLSTEEGLMALFESFGVKQNKLGKNAFKQNLEANRKVVEDIEQELQRLCSDFRKNLVEER